MSKQRIIDYVMNTPGNTNPNVLNSLLDEEMNDLPPIGPEDKNKYLHTNESTGDLEWATAGGSGGGGVLVVHDVNDTLDKTWQEIHDAILSRGAVIAFGETTAGIIESAGVNMNQEYIVVTCFEDTYTTATASGYPTLSK